jgi:hypothetical protein
MQMNNLSKEQFSNTASIISLMIWYKMSHFGESINNHENAIPPLLSSRQSQNKVHRNISQGEVGTGKGIYKPWLFSRDLAF